MLETDNFFDKEVEIDIPHNFEAREYQKPIFRAFLNENKKRGLITWHRRAGKEKSCWNLLVIKALREVGIYYYFFPTFSQGRKVIWDGMDKSGFKFLDHIPKEILGKSLNNTEMKISLSNGSLIQVIGTDNWNSIMGTNPRGAIFSEYSLQTPHAWQYLRPIFKENGGWAIFNGTPRGRNHFYDLYEMAKNNEDWFCQKLGIEDTGVLTPEDMEEERKEGMSEDMIQQEYYCSFSMGIEGSYYGKYLDQMQREGKIGTVPYQPTSEVHTAWDLGIGDATSIIFFQLIGNEIHIIDFFECQGEGLPFYARKLQEKGYLYGKHYAPHDIENRELGSGLTRKEIAEGLGIRFEVLKRLPIEDGIEMARSVFFNLWIDEENCSYLIKCLMNYHKKYNEKYNCYSTNPVHDWSSHAADCFRYMAVAYREGIKAFMKPSETLDLRRKASGLDNQQNFFGIGNNQNRLNL